eukprot:7255915-Lingulodinium_polyedra.AAC.1
MAKAILRLACSPNTGHRRRGQSNIVERLFIQVSTPASQKWKLVELEGNRQFGVVGSNQGKVIKIDTAGA